MFEVAERLKANASITNVAIAHCEPTLGVLNSIEAIAELVAACGRSLLIDAVSPFAALPLGAGIIHYVEVVASANKCLEEAPGVGFMIVSSDVLEGSAGNAHSLSLVMYDHWVHMEKNWAMALPNTNLLCRCVGSGDR